MSITRDADWWRNAVIYQVYPKSFADSDGDGIGDIAGIRSRLPHLARLGVDALWVCPWYLSPQVDGGYDVTDHRMIDPVFGTLDDVDALLTEAHDLGLKVIVDIVPNHTSAQHRFFQEVIASPPGSPAWGRYHCLPGADGGASPPNDWQSKFGGPAWDPIPDADGRPTGWWYLHLFDAAQPDLNWDHPDVRLEFTDILRFWFDRGVDGFRIDVAHGLVKRPDTPDLDRPEVHQIWREWRRVANQYAPPRVFVGEVWVDSPRALAAYLRREELHTAFNFDYLKAPWHALEVRSVIGRSLLETGLVGAPTTWVLENHDVPRVRTRFALEPAGDETPVPGIATPANDAPANGGPDDALGLARARAGMLFMLGLPGSAYIYQGQELGLPEVLDLPAEVRADPAFRRTLGVAGLRDGCRVPIPWTRDGASFGFSPTGASWLPQPAGWGDVSVAAQAADPTSMLELTRRAIRIRRTEPALGDGTLSWISRPQDSCLVLRRPADGTDPHVIVALNMGARPAVVRASEVLLSSGPQPEPGADGFWLDPDTSAWFR